MSTRNERCGDACAGFLDDKTRALVRLGALVAIGGGPDCYRRHVTAARAAGATDEEVVATFLAVAPTIGMAGLVRSSTHVARSLGYDIDCALERLDDEARTEQPPGGPARYRGTVTTGETVSRRSH